MQGKSNILNPLSLYLSYISCNSSYWGVNPQAVAVFTINKTISVETSEDDFEFALVNSSDINQIKLTSSFLELDNVKLSDCKFQVSLAENDNVSLTLNSNSPVFQGVEKGFTLSVKEGYNFESISAVDADGNEVELTEVTDGVEYSVIMPYSKVIVTVVTSAVPVEDTPVLGLTYSAEVDGYTDYWKYYEECTYDVSFEYISNTQVRIIVDCTSGFTYGTPDSIDETFDYTYDSTTRTITIDDDSSKTLTYNDDGSLTCNYKLSINIDGTKDAVFTAPVSIPVSGNTYSGSAEGYDYDYSRSLYNVEFDFISDTQVHITLEIDGWSTGASLDETVSYSFDSSTNTIVIDGDSDDTLTLNEDGSLICHYDIDTSSYVDFSGQNFSLDN